MRDRSSYTCRLLIVLKLKNQQLVNVNPFHRYMHFCCSMYACLPLFVVSALLLTAIEQQQMVKQSLHIRNKSVIA